MFAFSVSSQDAKGLFLDRIKYFIENLPWFRKDGLIGYSFRQAFSERDAAYAAALSVAKASDDLVNRVGKGYRPKFRFAFPVIVVDSPLINCSLRDDGELILTQTSQGEFLFRADLPTGFSTCIRVVTIEDLPRFATEARRVAIQLREDMKLQTDEAFAELLPRGDSKA